MYLDDKDFDFKWRMQKVFWKMGYWTRIDVPVLHYDYDQVSEKMKRSDLTDIDVYGELIDGDYSCIKFVVDCKSGKNAQVVERMFWLKGIMEYKGASNGYLVKKKISNNIRPVLEKLNIYAISPDNLSELEEIYNVNTLDDLFGRKYYIKRQEIIKSLEGENLKIYQYLSSKYWFNSNSANIKTLLTMLQTRDFYKTFEEGNKQQQFILLETIILLSRNILDCCNYCFHRGIQQINTAVLEYIHDGNTNYNTKISMVNQIRPVVQQIVNDSTALTNIMLQPSYYSELTKLCLKLVSNPLNYKEATRYLDILQHEVIMEKKIDLSIAFGDSYNDLKLKFAKDIISFYLSETNISENALHDVLYR